MDYEALGRYVASLEVLRKLERERDRLTASLTEGFRRVFTKDTGISRFFIFDTLSMNEIVKEMERLNSEIAKVAEDVNFYAAKCNKPNINLEVITWKD